MDKKEKTEEISAENKKECSCDKDCKCGCNEGNCCCCKCHKGVFKILGILIVFLAGMGFDSLLNCGPCPTKGGRPLPNIQQPLPQPAFSDAQGGNIIIINTDGAERVMPFGGERFHGKDYRGGQKGEEFKGIPHNEDCKGGKDCRCGQKGEEFKGIPNNEGCKGGKDCRCGQKGDRDFGKNQPQPKPQHEGEHAPQPAAK
jgi:hypothetical protein